MRSVFLTVPQDWHKLIARSRNVQFYWICEDVDVTGAATHVPSTLTAARLAIKSHNMPPVCALDVQGVLLIKKSQNSLVFLEGKTVRWP